MWRIWLSHEISDHFPWERKKNVKKHDLIEKEIRPQTEFEEDKAMGKRKICLISAMVVAMVVFNTFCAWSESKPQGDRPSGPPPEMIEACQGKSAGDTCKLTGHQDKTITGTCQASREDASRLVCLPKERPARTDNPGCQ